MEEHVEENLRRLQAESGESWEALASGMDVYDPNVAAWMRSQAAPEGQPKGRRSAAKSEA